MNDKKKCCGKTKDTADMADKAKKAYMQKSNTDPLGSYTGNSELFEKPDQDADDL